jgi:hypothetical protein
MVSEVLAQVTTTFPRIGPLQPPSTLEELVRYIFIVTIVILGLLILWRLIRAGISWMLAGEDVKKIEAAKSMIWNAFLGAIIILSSVIFLRTLSSHFTQVSVPVEPPRKVTKHEVISGQKGIAFCKSNCARDDVNCIEENCENFTGGSANVEQLIKSGYNHLIGYGDPEEGKKNYAIFFSKSLYEVGQPLSSKTVKVWLEEFNKEQTLDLSGMMSAHVGSYNTSEEKEIKVTFCERANLENENAKRKLCKSYSTKGHALKLENISGCKSETGVNVCDYVREIKIDHSGYVLITKETNFNGWALLLRGPGTFEVGGLAPEGDWAKQDRCLDSHGNEIYCDPNVTSQPGISILSKYIPVKSLLLIP